MLRVFGDFILKTFAQSKKKGPSKNTEAVTRDVL